MEELDYKVTWKELCDYVEKNILGYSDNQHMCKNSCLRVQGLRHGRNIDNHNQESYGNYTYAEILYAFKMYRQTIVDALKRRNIQGEVNKVAYATAIIRSKIGDVSARLENAQKSRERAESAINKVDTDLLTRKGSDYHFTEDQMTVLSDRYKDLW